MGTAQGRREGACGGSACVIAACLASPTSLPPEAFEPPYPNPFWWSHPFLGACPRLAVSWLCDLGWPWAAGSFCVWSCCEVCSKVVQHRVQWPVVGGLRAGGSVYQSSFGSGSPDWHLLGSHYTPGWRTLSHLSLIAVLQGTVCRRRE